MGAEVHGVSGGVGERQQIPRLRQPGQEDQAAGDEIAFQAQIAGEVDADRLSVTRRRRFVARHQDGVHQDPVFLQAHVTRVHREVHQVVPGVRVRGPYVQHAGERQSALVDQGAAGFDVQVVEVLQQEGGGRAAQHRRGQGENLVEVTRAGGGAVRGVQGGGTAHRAALVAQPVSVTAPGHRRTDAEHCLSQRGGPPLPVLRLGDVADTESAPDVEGVRRESPRPAFVHEQHALLQRPRLLVHAGGVEMVGGAGELHDVGVVFERRQQLLHVTYRGAEAAAPGEQPGARSPVAGGVLEPRQAYQDGDAAEAMCAHQCGETFQFPGESRLTVAPTRAASQRNAASLGPVAMMRSPVNPQPSACLSSSVEATSTPTAAGSSAASRRSRALDRFALCAK